MEAGKRRLRGGTQREANREEVEQLWQENERLKQLVADLSLANMTLKKKPVLGVLARKRSGRMKPERKREVIELVRRSPVEKSRLLGSWNLRSRPTIFGSADLGTRAKPDWWTGGPIPERCGIG